MKLQRLAGIFTAISLMPTLALATGHGNIWIGPKDYTQTCNENGTVVTLNSNGRKFYLGRSCDLFVPPNTYGAWHHFENGRDFWLEPGGAQFIGPLICDMPRC